MRTIWRYACGGRRRASRRDGDVDTAIFDWHRPELLIASIGILALSVADAAITLELIARGHASEANPFMAALLDSGPRSFVGVKMAVTGLGVIGLVLYANHLIARRFSIARALQGLLAAYVVLVGYELAMVLSLGLA